jgi:type IV pilus assembly protein PilB
MKISTEKLRDLLVRPEHVSAADFTMAEKEAEKDKRSLVEVLVDKDLIKDEQLGQLIAQDLGFSFINLRNEKIEEQILSLVPEIVARSKGIIAFARDAQEVKVGMVNPDDLEMRHILAKRFGQPVKPFLITKRDFHQALTGYQASLKDELASITNKLASEEVAKEEKDKVVVKIVDLLLEHAYFNKASDIHIEPYAGEVGVRFRIDGVMHTVIRLPKELLDMILTRIKIMARMRIDEHRAAQDGKFQFKSQGETIDVRVSIVPVTAGENVVMRLLSASSRQLGLSSLGLSGQDLAGVKQVIKSPHGMILVTGPTGCGKTTTIYEILKVLNIEAMHIASIEDPVEYDIEGVSQIQVNPKTNLTFAKGLRAIVRQDPDIIMVGEIRDQETAQIAVHSAMTGHLVLSTLHANDAATTLPRLLDMGIEPFLIASTVKVVIAQRLVRSICQKCRYSYEFSDEEIAIVNKMPQLKSILEAKYKKDIKKIRLYKGAGCKVCTNTGYSGRVGIFEILEIKENIKEQVINRAASDEILKVARKNGMTTMLEDGINKVFKGVTTLSEVLRVTRE